MPSFKFISNSTTFENGKIVTRTGFGRTDIKNLLLASQIPFESEINAGVIMNEWNIFIYTVKSIPAH